MNMTWYHKPTSRPRSIVARGSNSESVYDMLEFCMVELDIGIEQVDTIGIKALCRYEEQRRSQHVWVVQLGDRI